MQRNRRALGAAALAPKNIEGWTAAEAAGESSARAGRAGASEKADVAARRPRAATSLVSCMRDPAGCASSVHEAEEKMKIAHVNYVRTEIGRGRRPRVADG